MIGSDIKRRVQRRYGDANNIFLTDADIVDWINDAQLEICRQTKALTTTDTQNGSAYNFVGVSLPTDFLATIRVTYTVAGQNLVIPLTFSSIDELDSYGVAVENPDSDFPKVYYHSGNKLFLYPSPSTTDTSSVKHTYARKATDLTVIGSTIELPALYHNDIVTYCMARIYERDQNYRAMEAMDSKFLSGEAARRDDSQVQDDTYLAVTDWDWDL